jgi:hypothetical protein
MNLPLSIIALHTLGDWFLQSNWLRMNKSKHWDVLFIHCLVYTACFYFYGWTFMGVTFVTHFCTDFITSRLTTRWWFIDLSERIKDDRLEFPTFEFARVYPWKRSRFFKTIGIDQLIHFTTLALTLNYLNL